MAETSLDAPVDSGLDTRQVKRSLHVSGDHLAFGVFVLCCLGAGFLLLAKLGRYRWFAADEWEFLADRQAGDLNDWFRPHGGHLNTLAVLAYRAMFNVFGFNYVAYQAVLVSLHLTTVAVLRVIMRRAGVGPWIATVTAVGLLLFGSGEDNILWAFQINFVGAVLFGLLQLLLLDHDGPIDRRDWLGLLAGAAALLTSGPAIALVAAAGLAALIRRTWPIAAFHTVPLAVGYVSWWLIVRPRPLLATPDVPLATRLRDLIEWDIVGLWEAFRQYGHFTIVGVGLALLLVVGLGLAWCATDPAERRARAAVPGALLAAAVAFTTLTGWTRGILGSSQAGGSRYVYVAVVCILPALAIAADALVRRWRLAAVPVVVLLLVGIPGNVARFGDQPLRPESYFARVESMVRGFPTLPEAVSVDQDMEPVEGGTGMTLGWLRYQAENGRLDPPSEPLGPLLYNELRFRLSLAQSRGLVARDCRPFEQPVEVTLRAGEPVGFRERPVRVELIRDGRPVPGATRTFNPDLGNRLTAQVDDLTLRFTPLEPRSVIRFADPSSAPAQLCS